MESLGKYEAVLFEPVRDLNGKPSQFRILSSTFGTLRKIGLALDIPLGKRAEILQRMLERQAKPVKPLVISRAEAQVKEVVRRELDLDLRELPIVRHVDMDGGPYLTPVVVSRNPEGERYNVSWNRMMYLDSTHLAIYMSPHHLWSYFANGVSPSSKLMRLAGNNGVIWSWSDGNSLLGEAVK